MARPVTAAHHRNLKGSPCSWTIVIILLILWALGFFALHVGGGLIHLLLVIAVIVIIVNFVRGRSAVYAVFRALRGGFAHPRCRT